jgi:putative addiction module component (TIGR02574 family)
LLVDGCLANVARVDEEVLMRRELLAELLELTPTERLDLIGDLWDSLESADLPPLTKDQIEEMERRLAEHRANPDSALSWEEVRAELRPRFG